MGIAPPSFSGSPVSAVIAVSHAFTRARTQVASALQCIRQPAPRWVPLLTTSRGESWYRPDSRQAQDALQMLLLTPPDDLHPRLQAALQAIVVEHLQRRPPAVEHVSRVIAAITEALGTGCTLEDAYGSVPTADRDALWLGGPYRDRDPARELLLNYLALIQGQVIEMALSRRQYANTDCRQLPEGFAQQQAALQERLEQVQAQALASEALVEYRQFNQWLYRQEWLVQLPFGVVQRFVTVLLLRHFALTPLARQLIACCRGQVSAQTLSDDWRIIGSQLKYASTPREFLDGISSALEQGPLSLFMLMDGLYRLSSMTLPSILLSVFLGAVAEAGQQALSGRLRKQVGKPALESTRFLQSLNRLAGNYASLKQHAQPPLDALQASLKPATAAPLGITQVRYRPQAQAQAEADVRMRWSQDQELFQQGGSLPPGASEPLSTSVGNRPAGLLQLVRQVARGLVGMMWRAPAVIERELDMQTPLYDQDPHAVYRPTTTPMIATAQSRRMVAGLGGFTFSGVTLVLYRATRPPDTAGHMSTPGGSGNALELTPHGEAVLKALRRFHENPDGTLTSTELEVCKMLADPASAGDEPVWLRLIELLEEDFGPALAGLRDLVQSGPGPEADFAEFDALESVPVRPRRDVEAQAQTVPQVADEAMARQIIAWVKRALVSARWQDKEMQLQVFGEWVKRYMAPNHFLQTATPQERALWLEYQQRLADSYQRRADLNYNSLEQFMAQQAALQKAFEDVALSELLLTVLESKLKGDLRGGSYIPGLEVMTAALNGDPRVTVGRLQLSTSQGPDALTLIIPTWLVFVRRNPGGEEDGVVVYCPVENKIGVFSTQQEIIPHLDLRRFSQSLQAQVRPPETRPNLGPFNTPLVPKPLLEVVLEFAPRGDHPGWKHFFEQYGRKPHLWTSAQVQVVDVDVNLHASLERRAGALVGREQARLQARLDDPYLSSQEDVLLQTQLALGKFNDEYSQDLRTFAQRDTTDWLSRTLHRAGAVPANDTVDADTLIINFNGVRMSLSDGVLGGHRGTADNVFSPSNNFLQYATIEHDNPAVALAMNQPQGKQGLQEYMRSTYPATAFIAKLEKRLKPEDEPGRRWRRLYQGVIKQGLQVALARGKGAGQFDHASHQVLKRLVDGLPDTTRGGASLHALHIGRVRIPGVLVLSQEQGADYVYLYGPYGLELMKLSDYLRRLNTPAYRDDLQARTLTRYATLLDNALRGAVGKTVHTVPITDFNREVVQQWLRDQIDNAREATTSRNQVRWEQALKGLRFTVGALCMTSSAGIAAVACGAGTFGLGAYDVNSALRKLERGRLNEAFGDIAFLWADMFEVGGGLGALPKVLHWAGKVRFANGDEFGSAVTSMVLQRNSFFTPQGRINDVPARGDITLEPLSKLSVRPGKAQAGDFYAIDGKYFVMDRYQDQVQVYEVYSDNAWATVRVRDPQQPNGHGAPVHYRDGHWRVDDGGLPGGGVASSNLGTEEKSHLLGEGTGPSGFRSEKEREEYFQMLKLDSRNPSDAEVIRAINSAIDNNTPLPQLPITLLKNKNDGWRAFGVFGQKPFGFDTLERNFDPNTLKQVNADFDFPNDRVMYYWFLNDRQGTKWPDWGIEYARGETVLNHYAPVDVLIHQKAFPSALVAKAFVDEFNVFPREVRKRLLNDMINGREVPLTVFPERVLVNARVQELIESGAFADAQAVSEYLAAFSLPNDILIMALLKARTRGGRTPAWAGAYLQLESWKLYESTLDLTPQARRLALQQVLVSEGVCIDLERADDYLKQFSASDELDTSRWELHEEVVMAALVEKGRRPVWAIESVKPESLMNIYRSEDIPKDMSRLEIVIKPGHLESSLRLPENMAHLKSLTIVSDDAITTPIEVLLPSYMRKLENLHLEGIILVETLSLDKMYELAKVVIVNCEDVKVLDFSYLLKLQSVRIVKNPQLHEFKVGRGIPRVQTLDVSSNQQLHGLALGYPMDELQTLSITDNPNLQSTKLPATMPELQEFNLQGNNLRDLSCLRNTRLPALAKLDLSRNQLSSLALMPRAPSLEVLQLDGNAFKEIPRFVTDLATPVKVNMIDNFISDSALRDFGSHSARRYPDQAVVQLIDRADEQSIQYARPLGEMVAICSVERAGGELRSLWGGFESEAYATEFSTFLGHLYQSKSFDDAVFGQQVSAWLERLATSTELRRETFRAADSACASCEDWVSSVYNSMQEIALRFNV